MPRISVIIVNYNSGDRLKRCLDCLEAQSFKDFETIIVDNASSDNSLALIGDPALDLRVIEAGANIGFAAANNLASETAQGDWLAFLNPDAYARPDWLAMLVRATQSFPDVDAFGSTQLMADDPSVIDGAGDVFHILGIAYRGHYGWPAKSLPPTGECFAPCAAAALYRRSAFSALGGFDESFFCYGEDVDLGFRLRLTGGYAMQIAEAVVLHEGSGVSGRESDFTIFHGNRNRIWLTYKNMPALLYWPFLPIRLAGDLYLMARWAMRGKARPYWRAIISGYGGLGRLSARRREIQSASVLSSRCLSRRLVFSIAALTSRRAMNFAPGIERE